ncbi:MAG: class I SAM-dependent methyltransferase [Patescibacteria group bacterium]
MTSNQKLLNNLQKSLSRDRNTFIRICGDFQRTFQKLGIDRHAALTLTMEIIAFIRYATSIEEAERRIKHLFESRMYDSRSIFQMIRAGLEGRFEKIFTQIVPYLGGIRTAIDYGCGSGVLTQMIRDRCDIAIEGVDIRSFLAPNVSVPIHVFDGYHVPVPDNHFECGIVTNILHHDPDNEKILQELSRIVSGKVVIIETVPEADNEEEARKDWDRMILNDALWNRFFNYADIPVPGTYEIPRIWITRIKKYFTNLVHSQDLGFDQDTIQDRHHLLVFEK